MFILRNKTYVARINAAHERGFNAAMRHAASVADSAANEYDSQSKVTHNTKRAVCAQLRLLANKLRGKAGDTNV